MSECGSSYFFQSVRNENRAEFGPKARRLGAVRPVLGNPLKTLTVSYTRPESPARAVGAPRAAPSRIICLNDAIVGEGDAIVGGSYADRGSDDLRGKSVHGLLPGWWKI
jgi:hypothetical protein